jgi:hypothetical protein
MYRFALLAALLGLAWPITAFALEEQLPQTPGVNERLNNVLGSEGGVQVYMDPEGNVGTILDPPGGERRITVQPPQSPSRNLGPPLQLDNPPFQVPQTVAPSQPPALDLPQKAR